MRRFSLLLFICLSCLFSPCLLSQSLPRLEAAIAALEADPAMRSAQWGISVLDARTGQVLASHHAEKNLVTASTMKALTTATVLSLLGPDFRYETTLAIRGEVREGELLGDLVITGSGDPSLGSHRFGQAYTLEGVTTSWVAAIRAAGIRRIRGRIIGDGRVFSSQLTPPKWPWEDMGNYYGAGASGLNLHENFYYLSLKAGSRAGLGTEVLGTEPAMPELGFVNELLTGSAGSGDQAYIFGSPYTATRYLRGTIPAGRSEFTIKGSVGDPEYFCARRLNEALQSQGVTVEGQPTTARLLLSAGQPMPPFSRIIHTHRSPSLAEIILQTNHQSINLYAEALLKQVAVVSGKAGSTEAGVEAVAQYWQRQGVPTRSWYLRDGSGLSPNNALSPYQLALVLVKMQQGPHAAAFDRSLPVAGKSGSLRRMLKGTAAEGRLRAKSGFISGVRGYAGYVETLDGRLLSFCMLANYFDCGAGEMRRKFERLMVGMAEGK